MLILSSAKILHFQLEITNQGQQEGLDAENQACVRVVKCANDGETTYCYRKAVYLPSSN